MQPTKIDNRQEDIFRGRLSNELNPKHEMMILSRLIPWDSLESEFSDLYQSNGNIGGQPPKPIRLMIGILLLQHLHNLSDEQVVKTWVEKPLLAILLWLRLPTMALSRKSTFSLNFSQF